MEKPSVQTMCTLEKKGSLYILTLTGPGEHRLNPKLLDAIHSALVRVKAEVSSGPSAAALITTAEGKFFSNGYDLALAQSCPSIILSMSLKLRSVIAELISFPMPTIAAITGHASAAGLMFVLAHDYAIMRKDRGFLYMSELDIGLKISARFMALIRSKVGNPATQREMVLRAAKLTAKEAVEMGIIDSAYVGAEETVKAAVELGQELVMRNWDGHVYCQNRKVIYKEVLDSLGSDETVEAFASTRSKL